MANKAGLLEPLAAVCSSCSKCSLAQTREKVVFGEGNPDAPLMVVGEGPGETEDHTGRPFVGRAGALLDECLAENRITRNHVYITNVVKCRACVVEQHRKKNRAPSTGEIAACKPWLDEQLAIIEPLVVLCLGGPAASTLIHKNFKIMQERGKLFSVAFAQVAIATLHPAYVLRQGGQTFQDARATLIADIGAARRKVAEIRNEVSRASLFQ